MVGHLWAVLASLVLCFSPAWALQPGGEVVIGWPTGVPGAAIEQTVVDYLGGSPTASAGKAESFTGDGRPVLALVIDDFGPNLSVAQQIFALKGIEQLTPSILPGYQASGPIAQIVQNRGLCHLIHLPMQALVDRQGSREYLIGTDTPRDKIFTVLRDMKARFPAAYGVNNHRGSKATSDQRVMDDFTDALSELQWPYLDSRTIAVSVGYKTARAKGLACAQNNVFIDGKTDLAWHKVQFAKAIAKAKKSGGAVAICHARSTTLPFLRWVLANPPKDVQLVTLQQYIQVKEQK